MSKPIVKVKEFIAELMRIGTRELEQGLGAPTEDAERVMNKVADSICTEYARRHIYVPAAYDPRNREIVAKYGQATRSAGAYSAARVVELAAEYALTARQIYSILREARAAELEARAAEFAARQGVLPGLDSPPESTR